jgi:hypothetical protein
MIFIVFFLSLVYVFLKAFQQRNVTLDTKLTILPISLFMGICEYAGMGIAGVTAANEGVLASAVLGLGAGLGGAVGCYTAIYLHKRFHR